MPQTMSGKDSSPDAKVPLILTGKTTDIRSGCFEFKVAGASPDKKAKVLLIPGDFKYQLDITKGWKKTMMVDLFKLIDKANLWGLNVPFFAVETTGGKIDMKTVSKPVVLPTPVAPFKGQVSLEGLGKDKGMTYTGNGKGRYLYTTPINGWYFLKYGSDFERDPKMRGFDCITYVGSARQTMSGMNGRGDKLAAHLGAKKVTVKAGDKSVELEDVDKDKVVEFFKKDGKSGTYIAWWKTHVVAVKGGTVHEFSQSQKGYATKAATSFGWPSKGNHVRKLK